MSYSQNNIAARLKNIDDAVAAQRIEGLTVPPENIEDMRRVARGEISSKDFISLTIRRYQNVDKVRR